MFRIDIKIGDVIVDRGEVHGDGVNVAARLEGLAEAGGICIFAPQDTPPAPQCND